MGGGEPRRILRRASWLSPGLERRRAWSRISQPGRGSSASAPKRTSTAVIVFWESEACRAAERLSQMPPGRDSQRSAP